MNPIPSQPSYSVDWIVIGATAKGIGIALAKHRQKQKGFILERTWSLLPEFSGCLRPGFYPCKEKLFSSVPHELWMFVEKLKAKGILGSKVDHPVGIAPALATWIQQEKIPILFQSTVVFFQQLSEHQWILTYFGPEGVVTIQTREVFVTYPLQKDAKVSPYLYTLIRQPQPNLLQEGEIQSIDPQHLLIGGKFPTDAYLRWQIPFSTGYPEARKHLLDFWKNRVYRFADWKLIMIAPFFSWESPWNQNSISIDLASNPNLSSQFPNPIEALAQGIQNGGY